jgi:hypothetical protein
MPHSPFVTPEPYVAVAMAHAMKMLLYPVRIVAGPVYPRRTVLPNHGPAIPLSLGGHGPFTGKKSGRRDQPAYSRNLLYAGAATRNSRLTSQAAVVRVTALAQPETSASWRQGASSYHASLRSRCPAEQVPA